MGEFRQPKECQLGSLPQAVYAGVEALFGEAVALTGNPLPDAQVMEDASVVFSLCAAFLYAADRLDEDYAVLATARGKERRVELYCLLPAKEIARVTQRLSGSVFFAATLSPLAATKRLLGGEEEDACFSLPSPFPPENLAVIRRPLSTRYRAREGSAEAVARAIAEAAGSRRGKYIAYFPSYAYLRMVQAWLETMETPPLWVQDKDMSEAARQAFLDGFALDGEPKLGLCVLGSLFSEGIDLPGEQLIGVMIVGVGLPVPTLRLRAVQACYARHFGDGFAYACRIPGMQKVLQAAGRVIRSETDRGLVLLLDERYFEPDYARLLPGEWRLSGGSPADAAGAWG
jgi:Rad3-related DNA helicase